MINTSMKPPGHQRPNVQPDHAVYKWHEAKATLKFDIKTDDGLTNNLNRDSLALDGPLSSTDEVGDFADVLALMVVRDVGYAKFGVASAGKERISTGGYFLLPLERRHGISLSLTMECCLRVERRCSKPCWTYFPYPWSIYNIKHK